jgi:ribosomal protein L3 glutamine methyltransferase
MRYTVSMNPTPFKIELPCTVGDALQHCAEILTQSDVYFGHGTDNAWDEAVQLVLSVVELPLDADAGVLPHDLTEDHVAQLIDLLDQRTRDKVPLPYLLGRAWFAGLEFGCDSRAIIPRSPLAELIRNDFRPWYCGPPPAHILDLCCGGGCIGLATAHYLPQVQVDLADLDEEALQLARENVERLSLSQRVTVVRSDLFESLGNRRYDLILSNPPYVDAADLAAMPAEFGHEPPQALGSGPDGLALTRVILALAAQYLTPEGMLIVEVGNSWEALEAAYPRVPFTWLEFEHGGHGVFVLSAKELQEYGASFSG